MTVVKVSPGPCGFEARIRVERQSKYVARLFVESDCKAVAALGRELEKVDVRDIVGKGGFGRSRPFKCASRTLFHAACPLLAAMLKAAEVELGLAVPRDVTIKFTPEED